jgi:alginate O-acetyltransferase complex protein AlgI
LCGLWHGASVSFVVWGLWHGVFLVLERAGLSAFLGRRHALLQHAYLLAVVMLGWVFFRAASLEQALDYLRALGGLAQGDPRVHRVLHFSDAEVWTAIACGAVGAAPWLPRAVAWWQGLAANGRARLADALEYASIGALALVFVDCAMKLAAGSYSPFIYFRF